MSGRDFDASILHLCGKVNSEAELIACYNKSFKRNQICILIQQIIRFKARARDPFGAQLEVDL